jgi:hypothetical protein
MYVPNPIQDNFDGDELGNDCDTDDDNDSVIDKIDFFDMNPFSWADFDFDGIPTEEDIDDDNDGILDTDDVSPIPISEQLATINLEKIQGCALLDEGTASLICYSNLFDEIVKKVENNVDALELSISLAKLGAIDDCHFVSHEIGHTAYEENPNVVENLIGVDGSMCRGGYFHGTLAAYFHNVKENSESFPDSYMTICDGLIGSSNYQDCIHGLGHGFVHYYLDDLESSVQNCHTLSFYQTILCIKGVMMQYTDNKITRYGLTEQNLSNLCPKSQLDVLDYQQCTMSIGSTLAFHTRHNLEEGTKPCELISDEEGKSFCQEGLRLEIDDSKKYIDSPLTSEIREKFQPQFIKQGSQEWIVDILTPAIISNFNYNHEMKLIQFSFDKPTYITMYIPADLMQKKSLILVNGQAQKNVEFKTIFLDERYVAISVVPQNSGLLQILGID